MMGCGRFQRPVKTQQATMEITELSAASARPWARTLGTFVIPFLSSPTKQADSCPLMEEGIRTQRDF